MKLIPNQYPISTLNIININIGLYYLLLFLVIGNTQHTAFIFAHSVHEKECVSEKEKRIRKTITPTPEPFKLQSSMSNHLFISISNPKHNP
jgi:hypothetical protein